jgi:hypothetical protein
LRVIPGGAPDQARLETERWIDEGGSFELEAMEPPPAATGG